MRTGMIVAAVRFIAGWDRRWVGLKMQGQGQPAPMGSEMRRLLLEALAREISARCASPPRAHIRDAAVFCGRAAPGLPRVAR
jgi:hypothetical protein